MNGHDSLGDWLKEVESGNEPGLRIYETDKKIVRAMVDVVKAAQEWQSAEDEARRFRMYDGPPPERNRVLAAAIYFRIKNELLKVALAGIEEGGI